MLSTLLTACSGQFWANTLTPFWGYDRHTDIAYGDLARRKLDIYAPNQPAAGAPVVVFFYGGGWNSGDKTGYRFMGQALAARGITAVLPDYRVYPATVFPGFVEDAAAAVAWTRANIARYGGDPTHLFVAGHSAGAHIAAMLATDGRYLQATGSSIGALSGFIGLSGPYDFLPIRDPTLQTIFAPRSEWPRTQPIHFVDGDEPPMLLLTGAADQSVDPGNTQRLAERVRAYGGVAVVKVYPGVSHMRILAPFVALARFTGDELDQVQRFVARYAGSGSASGEQAHRQAIIGITKNRGQP